MSGPIFRVVLNEAEQRLAKYLGRARQAHNERLGLAETKVSTRPNLEIHIQGAGAELAFCRLYNAYPDLDTEHWDAPDVILHNGQTLDVKTTEVETGKLLLNPSKLEKHKLADCYALMTGRLPYYRFAGWFRVRELMDDSRWDATMPQPCYSAPQGVLHSLPELIAMTGGRP